MAPTGSPLGRKTVYSPGKLGTPENIHKSRDGGHNHLQIGVKFFLSFLLVRVGQINPHLFTTILGCMPYCRTSTGAAKFTASRCFFPTSASILASNTCILCTSGIQSRNHLQYRVGAFKQENCFKRKLFAINRLKC
jgi:hypothetical protein